MRRPFAWIRWLVLPIALMFLCREYDLDLHYRRRGQVYDKAAWADVASVVDALENFLLVEEGRKRRDLRAPFPIQCLDFRPSRP